jgi:hypothetical protein
MTTAEQERPAADPRGWRRWGPYLAERDGRRPVVGPCTKCHVDAAWHNAIAFHQYVHGDTGASLGASHQTGRTGLVADLLLRKD